MVEKQLISPLGPKFSKLILGLWRLPDLHVEEISKLIYYCLDYGITTIDQADIYGNYQSQSYFGKFLKHEPGIREKIEIVSKTGIHLPHSVFSKSGIGYYNTSKKHIIESVNKTLQELNTDFLDLLLIHRPDPLMNPDEMNEAFQQLKSTGKVLHFGVSNFTPSQFEMLKSRMETPLVTNQVEFSVLNFAPLFDNTFDSCIKNEISPMIWSPLAGGRLFTEDSQKTKDVRQVLSEINTEIGASGIDQIALSWIMQHPSNPFIILGTLKLERVKLAVESLNIKLTKEQWFRILVAAQGHPVP